MGRQIQGPHGNPCGGDSLGIVCGGDGGDDGSGGFCDASGNCCAGTGVDGWGHSGLNGVPWNWTPGYAMQTTTRLYQMQAGVSPYLSIINTGWDPVLGVNWSNPQDLPQYLGQGEWPVEPIECELAWLFSAQMKTSQ